MNSADTFSFDGGSFTLKWAPGQITADDFVDVGDWRMFSSYKDRPHGGKRCSH